MNAVQVYNQGMLAAQAQQQQGDHGDASLISDYHRGHPCRQEQSRSQRLAQFTEQRRQEHLARLQAILAQDPFKRHDPVA